MNPTNNYETDKKIDKETTTEEKEKQGISKISSTTHPEKYKEIHMDSQTQTPTSEREGNIESTNKKKDQVIKSPTH